MSKTFDKISWKYVIETLKDFVYHPTWIHWISSLISSSFSILINGSPSPTFKSSRGIRQGDPLSPFLFILMAEGISRTITYAINSSSLQCLTMHNMNPPLSHTQLVDNTTLMGEPTLWEARTMKTILNDFVAASSTSINESKSQIFLFNTPLRIQLNISQELGFHRSSLPTRYLGIQLSNNSLRQA
jgi:hypothetical protein